MSVDKWLVVKKFSPNLSFLVMSCMHVMPVLWVFPANTHVDNPMNNCGKSVRMPADIGASYRSLVR
jgi:hypothetical protein